MNWASRTIDKLNRGETSQLRPHGNSMRPKINSGDLVTIAPSDVYNKGDMVLVKVNGRVYLHLIKSVRGKMFCISNNKGHINGWVTKKSIYGKVICIEK
jgi:phage repressor protein C with HTH and peptisase S24 domain